MSFARSAFEGRVSFANATFKGAASFEDATFRRGASFAGARFCDLAWFGGALFCYDVDFGEAVFEGDAFGGRASRFSVLGMLRLADVVFHQPVELAASAESVRLDGTTFEAGGLCRLRWAEIEMRGARIRQALTIAVDQSENDDVDELIQLCQGGAHAAERGIGADECRRRTERTERPRLLSLDGTSVDSVALWGVDLRACHFTGAHMLDQLELEDCRFPQTPGWTGRRAIWEEHRWRDRHRRGVWGDRWYGDANRQRPGAWLGDPQPPQIAKLYRALRKGLEDKKDEPGAADFYYGEMEMRRHSRAEGGLGRRLSQWWEGRTVWLYWLLSGYALRPFRSFVALLVVIAISTALFHQYGIGDLDRPFGPPANASRGQIARPPPYDFPAYPNELREALSGGDIWVYSASTAASIAPTPDARLTSTGRAIRAVERILGPILLGLMLLSIRGRVKR